MALGGTSAWAQSDVSPAAQTVADPAASDSAVVAEVAIVGGNVASARQRAIEQALLVAVERTFDESLAETGGVGAGQAEALQGLRTSLSTQVRSLTRSYRMLNEEEAAGRYRVRLDVTVDRAHVRRSIDRVRRSTNPDPATANTVVVAGDDPTGVGTSLAQILRAAGAQVVAFEKSATDLAAVRGGLPDAKMAVVVIYRTNGQPAGVVRGAGQRAATCQINIEVFPPGETRSTGTVATAAHGFAANDTLARTGCLVKAGTDLAERLLAQVAKAAQLAGAPQVTLQIDVDQPAALETLVLRLPQVPGVDAAELRRIAVGMAEIRVQTGLSPARLAAALGRELAGAITVTVVETGAATARVRVFFPESVPADDPGADNPPPAPGAAPGSAASVLQGQ